MGSGGATSVGAAAAWYRADRRRGWGACTDDISLTYAFPTPPTGGGGADELPAFCAREFLATNSERKAQIVLTVSRETDLVAVGTIERLSPGKIDWAPVPPRPSPSGRRSATAGSCDGLQRPHFSIAGLSSALIVRGWRCGTDSHAITSP